MTVPETDAPLAGEVRLTCGQAGGTARHGHLEARSALTSGSPTPSGSPDQVPAEALEQPVGSTVVPLGFSPESFSRFLTWAGVKLSLAAFISAATPATCGLAMLVPLSLM